MRDHYAGDLSDAIKFALLRALAGSDRTLGVAWYYNPGGEGDADGKHIEWRGEDAWRLLDATLHAGLSRLPERSIAALEKAQIWPGGSLFHGEPVPRRADRQTWARRKRSALEGADIVFLDPDNGIGSETSRHATFSEVRHLRRPGRAVVFIVFPGRSATHDVLLKGLHDRLAAEADATNVVTLRTNVSVPLSPGARSFVQRQRWFSIVDADDELKSRVVAFARALAAVPRVTARVDATQ